MIWKGRRGSGNIVDNRGIGGGAMGIGGLIIGGIIYVLMGGNPLVYLAQNADQVVGSTSSSTQSTSAQDDESKNFVAVVLADTEDVWTQQFAAHSSQYAAPKLVLFTARTRSACGSASSATGPFYCPADQRVYLDTSFFDDLSSKLGAQGDAAAAYVIAHEVGHHVQNLLGLYDRADQKYGARTNRSSVAVELQADCLAGIWAGQLEKGGAVLEEGDINEAMGAASAVGDDRLQSMAGGEVVPDSFTHGSSAQRQEAFKRGYQAGNLEACL